MNQRRFHILSARQHIVGLLLLTGVAAACTESPTEVKQSPESTSGIERSRTIAFVQCVADRTALTVTCGGDPTSQNQAGEDGETAAIVLGRQGVYVDVQTNNVNYDAGTGDFTFNLTVRNRIPQPIGTTNGVALDPAGVRVFFHSGPSVSGGTGTVDVPTPDGFESYTAPNQPYYQYNEVLSQFELSPTKSWKLNMPPTVTNFVFALMVNAAVQFPQGYIEVQPTTFTVSPGAQRLASAVVRSATGEHVPDAVVTWTSTDPAVLVIDPSTGVTTGVKSGSTSIVATSGTRVGSATFSVRGIQRVWNGNVDTNWQNVNNWDVVGLSPGPQFPSDQDTAIVPADRPNYPLFTSNTTVGGVVLQGDGTTDPFINIGSFDFSLNASIDHGTVGLITGPGRMIFQGTAQTISGGLSNVDYRNARFLGTYSLNANLNITGGRIVAQGGRLRSAGFRIRVRPN
jgi:hypothetical protein